MSDLKALEHQLAEAREFIQKKNQVEELTSNPLFKEIILQGFCIDDCARAIKASADIGVPKEEREDCIKLAQAAGYLEKYLHTVCRQGYMAEGDIARINEAIEYARTEEV